MAVGSSRGSGGSDSNLDLIQVGWFGMSDWVDQVHLQCPWGEDDNDDGDADKHVGTYPTLSECLRVLFLVNGQEQIWYVRDFVFEVQETLDLDDTVDRECSRTQVVVSLTSSLQSKQQLERVRLVQCRVSSCE